MPQELEAEEKEQSVYEFCSGRPGFLESSPKELARTAGKMGLDPGLFYSEQKMGSLSGGEKVKLQLAWYSSGRAGTRCSWMSRPTIWTFLRWISWKN